MGRPAGSKDWVRRAPRAGLGGDGVVALCRLQLLQLLLHTRDLLSTCAGDDEVRFLFAHTEAFGAWARTRRVDSLGLQLRTWLRRDLLPLIEGTRFFSRPPPEPQPRQQRLLLEQTAEWVRRGAPLDCLRAPAPPTWRLLLSAGNERWLAARQEQKRRLRADASAACGLAELLRSP